MNKLIKILIITDTVFCFLALVLMGLGILNINGSDIALVGGVIMSPEVLVAINKIYEKKTTKNTKEEKSK